MIGQLVPVPRCRTRSIQRPRPNPRPARARFLAAAVLLGCAASGMGSSESSRTSMVSIGSQRRSPPRVIAVQAGPVQVRHSVPSGGRLRATLLEGVDDSNRTVRYEWTSDGTYTVSVSGRYRHTVTGSVAGSGSLTSTLRYTQLDDGSE